MVTLSLKLYMLLSVWIQDEDSLTFLTGKLPQSSIMFVCNKIDIPKGAREFDNDDDDDDEDDEDDEKDEGGDNSQTHNLPRKGEFVFNQLKDRKLLSGESWQTCDLFHAISAKEVREERVKHREGEATRSFQRFQTSLQSLLGKVMKTQTKRVVQTLLLLQESFVNVVQVQRTLITDRASIVPDILRKANEIETKMFESLEAITLEFEDSKQKIIEQMKGMKIDFIHEAEVYKVANQRTLQREAQTMLTTDLSALSDPDLLLSIASRDIVLELFLSDMKGSILEKTCNALDIFVQTMMSDLVGDLTQEIIDFNEYFSHPIVSQILEESYGIQFLVTKAETDELLKVILNELLDSVKEAASIALRREISIPLSSKQMSSYSKKDVGNKAGRRAIVESLLEAIKEKNVAEAVLDACHDRLQRMLETFRATVAFLASLQTAFANSQMASQLEVFRMHFTPQIRTLAVEGMALKFLQNLGPVQLGSCVAKSRHGVIYECTSERWCRMSPTGQCVVKVLNKREMGEPAWNQTAVDLVNMM